jgi:hypothetical protein
MEVGGHLHVGLALPQGKEPLVPIEEKKQLNKKIKNNIHQLLFPPLSEGGRGVWRNWQYFKQIQYLAINDDLIPDPSVLLTVVRDLPQVSEFSPVVPARFATQFAHPLLHLLQVTWLSALGTIPSSDPVN